MAVQTAPEMLSAVSSVAAFRDLSLPSREAIAGISSLRHYRKDMYVFIEGDESEFLCFLHEGTVRAFRTTMLGTEQTLQIVRPGEIFSLTGFLHSGEPYPSTVQTIAESWIGFVRNDALRALVQRSADVGWALMQVFGARLRDQTRQMVELTSRDASAKIAATLLRLAEREGSGRTGLHFTHRELAQLVGCSRETVTRVMREFREDHCVEQTDDGRLIVHPSRLQSYAG
ncbi:MAG: Crp/Fnr family transcriptional regulator [Thermaerobacter sp.]|nr:Crp/Fnr family transcriptional regulator [Thermaerobacter sp.]